MNLIQILDLTTGKPLGAGEKGELWIKSPSIAKGYKDRPEENSITFVDGWFKTGKYRSFVSYQFIL